MKLRLVEIVLVCLLVAPGCKTKAKVGTGPTTFGVPSASGSASEAPSSPVSRTGPEAVRLAAAECDVDKAWYADFPEGEVPDSYVKTHPASFTKLLRAWTPDCRSRAMANLCSAQGCDEMLSSLLLDAAASPDEAKTGRTYRMTKNVEAVERGRAQLAIVQKIVTYALSIRHVPRPKGGGTEQEMVEDLANGNPCLDRMRKDFARIDAAKDALDRALPGLPFGLVALESALTSAKFCVDCADDRQSCDDLSEPMKAARDKLAEYDKLIAADRAALRAR